MYSGRHVPADAEFIRKASESLPSICENTTACGVMAAEVGRGKARISIIHEHMSVSRIFWGTTSVRSGVRLPLYVSMMYD